MAKLKGSRRSGERVEHPQLKPQKIGRRNVMANRHEKEGKPSSFKDHEKGMGETQKKITQSELRNENARQTISQKS